MDGHYVPNLTIGPPVVKSLRKHTDLFLDCHLMVDNPGVLLAGFADAGADGCTVHIELGDPRLLFDEIRALGMRGPVVRARDAVRGSRAVPRRDRPAARDERAHRLRRSAVHPEVLDKVRAARVAIDERALPVEIEIDGGIKIDNAHLAVDAGVDILVSGTGIFGADRPRRRRARHPQRPPVTIHNRCQLLAKSALCAVFLPTVGNAVTLAAKVLTVSDGSRGGTRDDKSGRALVGRAHRGRVRRGDPSGHERRCRRGRFDIAGAADGFAGLIVTTGGTGFGPRDLTPEGTRAVIEREAPGIVEAIRRASDAGGRGFGMLSRAVAGTRGRALICNLPGSSGGAIEGLEILLTVAPHALALPATVPPAATPTA